MARAIWTTCMAIGRLPTSKWHPPSNSPSTTINLSMATAATTANRAGLFCRSRYDGYGATARASSTTRTIGSDYETNLCFVSFAADLGFAITQSGYGPLPDFSGGPGLAGRGQKQRMDGAPAGPSEGSLQCLV